MESRVYITRNLTRYKTNKAAEFCTCRSLISIGVHLSKKCDCPFSANLNKTERISKKKKGRKDGVVISFKHPWYRICST